MKDFEFDVDTIKAALIEKVEVVRQELADRVRLNLSGDVLKTRSGALLNSITGEVADSGADITAVVESTGVAYAAILEYGGKTAAHDILTTKAQALAFMACGERRYAKRIHHPGSIIPAFAYMGGALDALEDELAAGMMDAVLQALAAQ